MTKFRTSSSNPHVPASRNGYQNIRNLYLMSSSIQLPQRKTENAKPFLGRLQPTYSRVPAKLDVDFSKGGSDFRCPNNTSAFGKQVLSGTHRSTQPRVQFSSDTRFKTAETVGPGPVAFGQFSSMKKQVASTKRSAESMNFGTSSRDGNNSNFLFSIFLHLIRLQFKFLGALKLYTVYTYKKN